MISWVILIFPVLVKFKRRKKILVPHYPGHSCIRPANNNGRLGRSPDSCFLNAPHHLKRRYYRLSCSQLRHSGCCGSTGSPSPSSASYVVLRKTFPNFCFHIIFECSNPHLINMHITRHLWRHLWGYSCCCCIRDLPPPLTLTFKRFVFCFPISYVRCSPVKCKYTSLFYCISVVIIW